MATEAEDIGRIGVGDLRRYVQDQEELKKGTAVFDGGQLRNLSRYKNKLYCEAKGSGPSPYKVTLTYKAAPGPAFSAQCTCPARKFASSGICKHGAALLVAWARAPESFAVSDGPGGGGAATPGAPGESRKREVKRGKVSAAELMKTGVEQVGTLVRELGVAGVASLPADRVDQIQSLGQTLRENKLRRLSARTLELARILAASAGGAPGLTFGAPGRAPRGAPSAPNPVRAGAYAGLMADVLLTARKLEKHLGGEPLDDRHVEELIGKTWQKGDRKPVGDLHLIEYAFSTRTTSDDFVIRESRFLDIASGHHYSEKQIIPAHLKRTEPKPSRGGEVLGGARGTTFPGYPPFRVQLDDLGDRRPLAAEALAAMVDKALPDVGAAIAALQEHRRDVFAPDLLPVALRVDTLFARGSRLQAVDDKGHALHVPEGKGLEEQLGGALRDARLRALLGDVGLDAALPTLWPVAAIIDGPMGLELRALTDPGAEAQRGPLEGSAWAAAAREAGASAAAIALGEVREELADALVLGLAGLTARVTDPLAARLRDLGLEKQAALLQALTARPEPADRLDDFIKLYQVLEIALVRLAGATQVDRGAIERVPTYESVFVERPEAVLPPAEVRGRRARGDLNRYQAALHYARYYSEVPAEELAAHIFPIWADGSATAAVVKAFSSRGAEAIRAAERALTIKAGRSARMTAVRVLHAVAGGGVRAGVNATQVKIAEDMLWKVARESKDAGLRAMAQEAVDALEMKKPGGESVRRRRAAELDKVNDLVKTMRGAPTREERRAALVALQTMGHRAAIPAIRQVFWTDASREVRHEAAHALAHVGDTEMVETFLGMLARRAEDEQEAKVAAVALGYLGDVRGLNELLYAYADGYKPGIVAEAIRSFGAVALAPLLDLIEAQPDIAKRTAALATLQALDDQDLAAALVERLHARKGQPDLGQRAELYVRLADVHLYTRRKVAQAVIDMLGAPRDPAEIAAVKAAKKAMFVMRSGLDE